MEYDIKYMRRALQLAAKSPYTTHPNPMVGAVIVHNDSIIGEGWHRQCGQAHAEVNAVASVADKSLLRDSTIYVTLEPCSHYGKTPPCAKLLIDSGIPRVVVGAVDPFEKVSGRGIKMLRDAGIEVVEGVLAEESRRLNAKFFTAHIRRRPFVTIKWAASADGYMDHRRDCSADASGTAASASEARGPLKISDATTMMTTHQLRAAHDAILTTVETFLADNPSLTVRHWTGPSPRRFVFSRNPEKLQSLAAILLRSESATFRATADKCGCREAAAGASRSPQELPIEVGGFTLVSAPSVAELLEMLYDRGVTSLLIEAGPRFLQAVIDADLYDVARIETMPCAVGSAEGRCPALTLRC